MAPAGRAAKISNSSSSERATGVCVNVLQDFRNGTNVNPSSAGVLKLSRKVAAGFLAAFRRHCEDANGNDELVQIFFGVPFRRKMLGLFNASNVVIRFSDFQIPPELS